MLQKKMMSYWKDLFDKNLKQKLKELDNCIENQSKFDQLVANLINNLDFEDSDLNEKEEKKETKKEDSSQSEKDNEKNDSSKKEDGQDNDSGLNVAEHSFEVGRKEFVVS